MIIPDLPDYYYIEFGNRIKHGLINKLKNIFKKLQKSTYKLNF